MMPLGNERVFVSFLMKKWIDRLYLLISILYRSAKKYSENLV